ncbi:MAG: glycosyltransferase [Bacteroidales bacterium]|nr:glycosyltransferase [Bacteroidales bacterium]
MRLTICTPWWNHLSLLPDYVAVVNAGKPDEVIVIDNGSSPDFEPVDIKVSNVVIRNRTNRGFSRACNQGLVAATGDAVLFLNNDVRLTADREWCAKVKEEIAPGVLVGAHWRNDEHTQVDGETIPYLDGWCIGGMRDDLIELGGWDEGYAEPSYYGDNDLCARAVARGFELMQVSLPIEHLEGTSTRNMALGEVTPRNYARYVARVRGLRVAA